MKYDVYQHLKKLWQESDKEYGKLIQKLLAIAFCKAGAVRLIERSTQGIDLEVTWYGERRIALEVKTTQDKGVRFGKKDLDGLATQDEGGLEPYFALLGSQLLDEWILARYYPGEIKPEQYSLTQLRTYRDRELEDSIREYFDEAVIEECPNLPATNRQAALDQVLRTFPGYGTA